MSVSAGEQCFVYVIGPPGEPQKIGIAKNVEVRRSQLQIGQHKRIVISYTLETTRTSAQYIEYMAHHLLRRWRLVGEWFDVTPEFAAKVIRAAKAASDAGISPWAMPPEARAVAARVRNRAAGKKEA